MNGRPLIAWAIDIAAGSGAFDSIVVSTDDDEIAEAARAAGALVPFMRPAELSDDHASTAAVMAHAVAALRHVGLIDRDDDLLCCAYPAAIGVGPSDYQRGRAMLQGGMAPYVTTVLRYAHPIQRAMDIDEIGRIRLIDPEAALRRTQDLPPRWHDAGQFYWGLVSAWADALPIFPNSMALELSSSDVLDIDTEEDWRRAQGLQSLRLGQHSQAEQGHTEGQ